MLYSKARVKTNLANTSHCTIPSKGIQVLPLPPSPKPLGRPVRFTPVGWQHLFICLKVSWCRIDPEHPRKSLQDSCIISR